MAVGDAHAFPGFLKPILTQTSFQSHQLLFSQCFNRGERLKYAGEKVRLNRVSNSQPPGHESDTLNTEPSGRVHIKIDNRGKNIVQSISEKNSRKAWVGALAASI